MIALVLALLAAPSPGRYVTTTRFAEFGDVDVANYTFVLSPAKIGNGTFNVNGHFSSPGADGLSITGALYKTGRFACTLKGTASSGKKIEAPIDGEWMADSGDILFRVSGIPSGGLSASRAKVTGTDFSGVYESGSNLMVLDQFGSTVTGRTRYQSGRIQGTVSGGTLTFTLTMQNGWVSKATVHKLYSNLEGEYVGIAPPERAGNKESLNFDKLSD